MSVSTGEGWVGVTLGILFWGTWSSFTKLQRVQQARIDSLIMQMYVSISVFGVTLVLLTVHEFKWSSWAIVGAAIWVPTSYLFVMAFRVLGIGLAAGVGSGCTILSSFLWGATATSLWGAPPCVMGSPPLAVFGVLLMVLSIGAMAYFGSKQPAPPAPLAKSAEGTDGIDMSTIDTPNAVNVDVERPVTPTATSTTTATRRRTFIIGVVGIICVGWLSGSRAVPLKLAQREGVSGIQYLMSFSIASLVLNGVMLAAVADPIIVFVPISISDVTGAKRELPKWHVKTCALPGLAAGLCWALGNVASTYAWISPLGQTIGFPLTQSNLLLAGVLGIVVFKEVTGKFQILAFVASAVVCVVGAVILARFGKCAQ